jgi:secreted PhoX family phosphatase
MTSDRSDKLGSGLSATQTAGGLKDSGGFSRRQFFKRSAMAGAATLSGGIFQALVARSVLAADDRGQSGPGYGALRPAGDELALPPGFHYSIVSAEGDIMSDGYPVPKAMDGMATFPLANGNILLIRNHEDSDPGSRFRPRPPNSTSTSAGILNSILNTHYGPRDFAYDEFAGGGTTSIEVDPHSRRVV